MKRITIFLLLILPVLVKGESKKPLVVATASIMADMTSAIGGNLIDVRTIVPIGGDPHLYEAVPGDAELVEQADLIVINGLTFEGWINELIENSGTGARIVTITEGIKPIKSLVYENASDPHAWMDPMLANIYIENIVKALIDLAPEFKEEFSFNYEAYKQEIKHLHHYCVRRIAEIPDSQRILITSHDAFQYYGRRYGLRLEAIMGTSTDAEVQTSDIMRVSDLLKSTSVPAVFIESTINPKLLQQIADDNGVVIGGQVYADSLSDEDGPASTYLNMIKHNTDIIVEALKKERDRRTSDDGSPPFSWFWLAALFVAIVGVLFIILRSAR